MVNLRSMVLIVNSCHSPAFQLKSNHYNLVTLELLTTDHQQLYQQLATIVRKSPNFFQRTSVIINLNRVQSELEKINLTILYKVLENFSLIPLGICGDKKVQALAKKLSVTWIPCTKQKYDINLDFTQLVDNARDDQKQIHNNQPSTRKSDENNIYTRPIRSGQQIYSNSDLVVLSQVGVGAELIAQRHVHVYGVCRGRILAGSGGNTNARVFCNQFEAELISIAGHYKLTDELSSWNAFWKKSVQLYLKENYLHIEYL